MTPSNRSTAAISAAVLALAASVASLLAQSTPGVISGPVGPSPYDIVRGWHKPFSEPGFTFGGNSGVFAESPNRIFVAQRGEYKLPNPVPPTFAGFAGSIGINVLSATAGRVWKNCLYTLDANGNVKERWADGKHFGKPQDVAFLPDGRILINTTADPANPSAVVRPIDSMS